MSIYYRFDQPVSKKKLLEAAATVKGCGLKVHRIDNVSGYCITDGVRTISGSTSMTTMFLTCLAIGGRGNYT